MAENKMEGEMNKTPLRITQIFGLFASFDGLIWFYLQKDTVGDGATRGTP